MADERVFLIGIDGGGTRCRARVTDAQGHVRGEGTGGPASLRLGAESAWAGIHAAMQAALDQAHADPSRDALYAGFGLAGFSRVETRKAVLSRLSRFRAAGCISDGMAACLGAHGGADGGVVIAGTGSIALAVRAGAEIRIGGYGIPVSDEGSGAAIGVAVMASVLRACDGRLPRTNFHEAVLTQFPEGVAGIVAWVDRASGTDYATFAPLAFEYAALGDGEARRIVAQAAKDIAGLVDALEARGVTRISLLGGLSKPLQLFLPDATQTLLHAPQGDACDGALIIARRLVPSAIS
ncbi:MAG: BadF/BadG/BcrA/BcrD ATPase family protein [Beijerinckiaceae bacterium]